MDRLWTTILRVPPAPSQARGSGPIQEREKGEKRGQNRQNTDIPYMTLLHMVPARSHFSIL